MGLDEFKASPSWISATLKRNKKVGINLHGEENDTADEDREIIMSEWSNDFHANIAEVYTPTECVYNIDQTGLYYQKLLNHVYVDEANKRDYAGVK